VSLVFIIDLSVCWTVAQSSRGAVAGVGVRCHGVLGGPPHPLYQIAKIFETSELGLGQICKILISLILKTKISEISNLQPN
jgi:hypothetical protein